MPTYASRGSQRWIQLAVNQRPAVLHQALRRSGILQAGEDVEWRSPLRTDGFREYRDGSALAAAGIKTLRRSLLDFWPRRGPVWDAIGVCGGAPIFVEAKAHIPETVSRGSRASESSLKLIGESLIQARRWYAPKARREGPELFYQYRNRLAHHFFLRQLNELDARLVFLYFVNARDVNGPATDLEWKGAIRLIHAALGLPEHLQTFGVFDAFVDVRELERPSSVRGEIPKGER
jgi:hypothetical protein